MTASAHSSTLAVDHVDPLDAALDAVHDAAEPRHARKSRGPGGSRQTDDSIGSSVKLTNSDTSTATATVRPNWKKNGR